jgi:putative salt-induced outer membrane protein
MKLAKRTWGAALLTLAVSASAMAADKGSENGLRGSGELGYANTTGNTDSTAVYGALKIDYIQQVYEFKSAFEINNKSEDGQQTQERYVGELQYNRFYAADKNYYSFVQTRFERDHFADLELDSLATLGLGKTFLKDDKVTLKAEAGLGYQATDYINADDTDQVIARLKGDFSYRFNEHVKFTQDAIVYSGSEQTKLETNSGLKVKMNGNLSLKLAYQYRSNSDPAPGVKKVDTQTLATLMYDF